VGSNWDGGAGKSGDLAELLEGGFEVVDDFLGENVGIAEIVGVFEAFVSKPENAEARFVAVDEFFVIIPAPRQHGKINSVNWADLIEGEFNSILPYMVGAKLGNILRFSRQNHLITMSDRPATLGEIDLPFRRRITSAGYPPTKYFGKPNKTESRGVAHVESAVRNLFGELLGLGENLYYFSRIPVLFIDKFPVPPGQQSAGGPITAPMIRLAHDESLPIGTSCQCSRSCRAFR
jgi:hypothetical protein